MTYLLIIAVSILTLAQAFGQQSTRGNSQSNSHIYNDGFSMRVREIPYTPGETEGSYYLFDQWSPGTITMPNNEVVRDVFLKYSFQKQLLEIKTDSGYYSLNVVDTKRFTIYDAEQQEFRQFVAAQDYRVDDIPLTGALEVLHEGAVGLVAKVAPKLVEANYKGALSGGSTNDKIIKEKEYFLVNGYQLTELPTQRKQAYTLLQQYDPDIEKFMMKERLKPKREEDLLVIVKHLNS